jgi:hypothetical protein
MDSESEGMLEIASDLVHAVQILHILVYLKPFPEKNRTLGNSNVYYT